jgi:DNA repair exonuclease SbcCD ATPase subunit
MQLLRLEVQNWVHHRHRACEFSRGLVAILGENGSGKSSLFAAINWLLTGENPNYGTKVENISQYAKDEEPAYAKLEFEHNGQVASVTRWLRPEKEPSLLFIDGKEIARGDRRVTEAIEALLGIDAKFISRFIIVGQMDIFSFIDQRQSEVDTFFQHLFGTAKAQKCAAALGDVLPVAKPPEIVRTSAEIALQRQSLAEEINAAQVRVDAIPTIDAFLKMQKADQDIISQWQTRESLAAELSVLEQREKEYAHEIEVDDQQLAQYESDLQALSKDFDGQGPAYSAAKVALAHWNNYKAIATQKSTIEQTLRAIEATRQKSPAPECVSADMVALAMQSVDRLDQELKRAQKLVEVFSADGVAECPTCRTPTTNLRFFIEDAKTAIPILRAQAAAATHECAKLKTKQQAYRDWQTRDQELAIRAQELQKSAAQLTAVAPPSDDEGVLQQTVVDYETTQNAKTEINELLQALREHRAQLAGVAKTISERKVEVLQKIEEIAATKADAQLATLRLEKLKEQCALRQALEKEHEELKFLDRQAAEQQQQSLKLEAEAARLKKWVAMASQTREAFKNAPRIVAMRNLQRLESAINELLQIFSVNFLVRVATDGAPTFVAEFYDGRKQVAQRLSVGQKTVLALAFRVAVNAMFADEIGLLALDEPTAALDAVRVQALAPVLEKLRELSTAKGLQCLLVTHATSLSHLFESTIELDAPETRHVKKF